MKLFSLFLAVWLGASVFCARSAFAACQLQQIAELHLVLDGNNMLVDAYMNGRPVRLRVDTGARISLISQEVASNLGLQGVDYDLNVYGVGGGGKALAGRVDLKLGGATFQKQIVFIGGSGVMRQNFGGLLGQDFLSKTDIELDVVNKVIRFLKPVGCAGDEVAYWTKAYSIAPMAPSPDPSVLQIYVQLNGRPVLTQIDTGAYTSIVTTGAASQAGVTPRSDGVRSAGLSSGLGKDSVETFIGTFSNIAVGDEKISNVKLRIADLFAKDTNVNLGSRIPTAVSQFPGMLLGADFIRSHRLYLAYSQRKIYFTYNGGPIFQVVGPAQNDDAPSPAKP